MLGREGVSVRWVRPGPGVAVGVGCGAVRVGGEAGGGSGEARGRAGARMAVGAWGAAGGCGQSLSCEWRLGCGEVPWQAPLVGLCWWVGEATTGKWFRRGFVGFRGGSAAGRARKGTEPVTACRE